MTQTTSPAAGVPKTPQATTEPVRTPWTEFWRKFRKQHLAMGAGVFVIALALIAILAPHIVPFDPENYFDYDALNAGPSEQVVATLRRTFNLVRQDKKRLRVFGIIAVVLGILAVAAAASAGQRPRRATSTPVSFQPRCRRQPSRSSHRVAMAVSKKTSQTVPGRRPNCSIARVNAP